MAIQTFACPACGSRKTLADSQPGEKIHCTCGMSFPASPVFGVAEEGEKTNGPGLAVAAAVGLLVGCSAVGGWLLMRPSPPSTDRGNEPVAVAVYPGDQKPEVSTDDVPPPPPPRPAPDAELTPAIPAVKPAEKPVEPAPPPPPPPQVVPVASVSAVTLWDAFELDPAAAAARYSDKLVEIKARGRVGRDSLDKPYFGAVVVKARGRPTPGMTAEQKLWEKEGYPPSVRCYLSPEQAATLETAPADEEVTLRGICTGRKSRGEVYHGYIVDLENCTIVAPK
jgi:hypothetical protein